MLNIRLKINNFNSEVYKIREEINELNVSVKEKILTSIIAFIIPLMLFSGLITFTINMFIYYDLYLLFVFLAYLEAICISYLTNYFYLVGMTKNQIKGIKKICLSNFIIYSIVLFYVFIMIYVGGY
jgi:hypothetical protein